MSSGNSALAGAAGAILAGTALLALAMMRPPESLCDPPVGVAHVALAAAQALALVAVTLLRRAGQGGPLLGAVVIAWGMLSGFVLAIRTCAGNLASIDAIDAAHAGGAALALACLIAGLSARLVEASPARLTAMALVAACAGAGAAVLMDGRVAQKTWTSWSRLNEAAAAVEAAAAREPLPPGEGVPLRDVVGSLPAELVQGLALDDGWGRPIVFWRLRGSWKLVSLGSDGEADMRHEGATRDLADDLVIRDGAPEAWPEAPCGDDEPASAPGSPGDSAPRMRP